MISSLHQCCDWFFRISDTLEEVAALNNASELILALGHPGELQDNLLVGWWSRSVKRGHQQAGGQYGSGPCFLYSLLDRVLLLTYSFVFITKKVSWTGPVTTMYEHIGHNVTETVAKVIGTIAAGKSRIKEEGARSVVLGLSCRSHGTSPG